MAGRVFFSDARWIAGNETDPYEREIWPQVLSGPKPTTFQHYVEQSKPNDRLRLHHYDDKHARLRGHKLYWHRDAVTVDQVEEQDQEKRKHISQYTRIKPLKAGQKFSFDIRFDNLSYEELGALAWILQLVANPRYRLKIGMGKPLGMGATRMTHKLQLLNRRDRYARLFEQDAARWDRGETKPEEIEKVYQEAIAAFETKITALYEPSLAFIKIPRIQELLKLLEWPGPDPTLTRYLEIERRIPDDLWIDKEREKGKRNEYRQRPVLPEPLEIDTQAVDLRAPEPEAFDEALNAEIIAGPPISPEQTVRKREPDFVAPSETSQQITDSTLTFMAARAAEREAEEERKRQERAERKKRRR